jgi:hypothetical protein
MLPNFRYYSFLGQRHKVLWFQNLGNLTFAGPFLIASFTRTSGPIQLRVADVNHDNRADVVVLQSFLNTLSFYSNLGAGVWGSEQTIAIGDAGLTCVDVCDVDGDGLSDLVVSVYRDDSVGWHRQIAPGKYESRKLVGSLPGASSVTCSDANLDGHIDIIATGMDSNAVCWYNLHFLFLLHQIDRGLISGLKILEMARLRCISSLPPPSARLWSPPRISIGLSFAIDIDILSDGDQDIVVGQYNGNQLQLFWNTLRDPSCLQGSEVCRLGWNCVNGRPVCSMCENGMTLVNGTCVLCPFIDKCVSMVCTTHEVACTLCEPHYSLSSKGTCTPELFYPSDIKVVSPGTQFMNAIPVDLVRFVSSHDI